MVWKKRVFAIATLVLLVAILSGLMVSPASGQQPERVKVLIGFSRQPGPAEEALVRGVGGTIKYTYHLVPAIAATLPEAAIPGLLANPNVTRIEPDGQVWAIDAELDNTWGVKRIGAGLVHGYNLGTGVKVAIIDTGIDYTHSDLDANYAGGYDFVNKDTDPRDDHGHGTHVAGTVGAEKDGVGVVGVVGVAPAARLYALKVLSASGSGYWSDIIAALQWAVDNSLQVTNNSYGSSVDPGSTVRAAFDNSYNKGLVHVAAAGNSGNRRGTGNNVIYPAKYASVIAVAATDSTDTRASFSSTGDQVELAAPGVGINSTLMGGGYGLASGTSMASPHVAGTAALVIASGISDANGNGRINDEVRPRLQQTAEDLGEAGRDPWYGYGLVRADKAAPPPTPANNPPVVSITSPADGSTFDSEASITFSGTATDTEDGDLTASLAWTSSIDGPIGSGGSFSTTLSDGMHTITASVTDTGGQTGSASITITVGTPPPTPSLSVTVTTDKPSYVHGEWAYITVTVTDGTSAVAGASVSLTLTTANGGVLSGSGTTNDSGIAQFRYKVNAKRDGVGIYTVVADASKEGFQSGSGSTTFEVTK